MKNYITLLLLFIYSVHLHAQQEPPARMNYQAAIRQNDGSPTKNQNVTLQFSILENSPTGSTLYTERQNTTTNEFGLVNLILGTGQVITGNLSSINWNSGQKWMKVELDATGGTNFSALGTTELVSVPYALSAGSATRLQNKPVNEGAPAVGQVLKWNGTEWTPSNDNTGGGSGPSYIAGTGINIDANNVISNTGDLSNSNELQTLSLTGNNLTLSNGGGSVALPVGGDNDATNEIQTLSISGTVLSLSKGGGSVTIPTGSGGTGDNWGTQSVVTQPEFNGNGTTASPLGIDDGGITLNKLSETGATKNESFIYDGSSWTTSKPVEIDGGQGINVTESNTGPLTYTITAADPNPTNEIQTLSLAADKLTLSQNGGTVTLPDASATNEIQTLSLSGANISLSQNGGTVTLPDASATNEIQTLSLNGNNLSLSNGGGSVAIPASPWTTNGTHIQNNNTGNVGIGIDPTGSSSKFVVNGGASIIGGLNLFGNLIPTQFVSSLGSPSNKWYYLYTNSIYFYFNNHHFGSNENGIACSAGDFSPSVNQFTELGTIDRKWKNFHLGTTLFGNGANAYLGNLEINSQWIKNANNPNSLIYFSATPSIDPSSNGIVSCGHNSFKWKDVWATNGVIQTSDITSKSNIRPISYGLDQVMQMQPVAWNWKEEQAPSGTHLGFIAQDIEKIVPDVVVKPTEADYAECKKRKDVGGAEGHPTYGMKYAELIPVLTKAIQEQQALIEKLEKRVQELENK